MPRARATTTAPGPIFGRQPAFWIGLIVTVVTGVVATLVGEGVISDALAGRITDFLKALAELAVLLAPLIAGIVIKTQVTPVAAPELPIGTPVLTPGQATDSVPAAVVSGASTKRP